MSTPSIEDLEYESKCVGAVPLLNHYLERMQLEQILRQFVPGDKRQQLAPAAGLTLMVRNILLSRRPLYAIERWARRFDPVLLGWNPDVALNDDRLGRCLTGLFASDCCGLIRTLVKRAIVEFDLDTDQIHNDSTTVTLSGAYEDADGFPVRERPTLRPARGHNKDHRPDLKQLLFILTTTADGAVPIWVDIDHGNTSDDVTHIRTWNGLCVTLGTRNFTYVADCKACVVKTLAHISEHHGRFLTVIPATWREHQQFHQELRTGTVQWQEILCKKNGRRKNAPPDVYRGHEALRTAQGYRVIWIWSSQKEACDRQVRENRLAQARQELQELSSRIGVRYSRLHTAAQVTAAAQKILEENKVQQWIKIHVDVTQEKKYKQAGAGRPGRNTAYVADEPNEVITLRWESEGQALKDEAATDGVFALTCNDENMSMRDMLEAYKQQPALEKRFQQLKSVLKVRPVMLHNPARMQAFLVLYYIALMVQALIERDTRQRMADKGIESLPLYPEDRPSSQPTSAQVFELFADLRRGCLVDKAGNIYKRGYDKLDEIQRTLLGLYGITPTKYMSAGEG
jgi:transposase